MTINDFIEFCTLPDGVAVGIAKNQAGYAVIILDTDAEMPLPTIRIFKDLECAQIYMKEHAQIATGKL